MFWCLSYKLLMIDPWILLNVPVVLSCNLVFLAWLHENFQSMWTHIWKTCCLLQASLSKIMPQKEAVSTTEPCSHLKATPLAEHFKFRFTPSPRVNPNHSACGEPAFGFAHVGLKRTSSSPVVFGNGRTHTGEVDGSGGSRLANYCLRASTS